MSQPAVEMSDIKRYFNSNPNYIIEHEGGDTFLKKLPTNSGKRGKKIVRIGHKFSSHTAVIPPSLLNKIKRDFGVTRQDILNS